MNVKSYLDSPNHIADVNCAKYFGEYFNSTSLLNFISTILSKKDEKKSQMILNNSARLSWVADSIDSQASGRMAFQILFYTIIAESSGKIEANYKGDRDSKKYVLTFFTKFTPEELRPMIQNAFKSSQCFLSINEVAELFYRIRCDLAHEGKYYDFFLKEKDESSPILNSRINPSIVAYITLNDVKKWVLSNSIIAAMKSLKEDRSHQNFKNAFWLK